MNYFLKANTAGMRLARTLFQAVIGVIITNIDLLMGYVVIDPALRPVVTGIVMAVLSVIMKELGGSEEADPDVK